MPRFVPPEEHSGRYDGAEITFYRGGYIMALEEILSEILREIKKLQNIISSGDVTGSNTYQ